MKYDSSTMIREICQLDTLVMLAWYANHVDNIASLQFKNHTQDVRKFSNRT
jgi:hypothetical protein